MDTGTQTGGQSLDVGLFDPSGLEKTILTQAAGLHLHETAQRNFFGVLDSSGFIPVPDEKPAPSAVIHRSTIGLETDRGWLQAFVARAIPLGAFGVIIGVASGLADGNRPENIIGMSILVTLVAIGIIAGSLGTYQFWRR